MNGNDFNRVLNRLRISYVALREAREILKSSYDKNLSDSEFFYLARTDLNFNHCTRTVQTIYDDMFSQVKLNNIKKEINDMSSEDLDKITRFINNKCLDLKNTHKN